MFTVNFFYSEDIYTYTQVTNFSIQWLKKNQANQINATYWKYLPVFSFHFTAFILEKLSPFDDG